MRVIVRNVQTGKYYKSPGEWTIKSEEAYDFKHTSQVIESKVWAKEEVVEIVFSFSEKKYDISILLGTLEPSLAKQVRPAKKLDRDKKSRRERKTIQKGLNKDTP